MLTIHHFKDGSAVVEIDGVTIDCVDGMIARCVADIADRSIPDAQQVARILNIAMLNAKSGARA